MQDRIPQNPGRVLITPEDGSTPFYAVMTRADNPTHPGTPLNKGTLLADDTGAMFGLGSGGTPNDALAELGKYNLHWWAVEHGESGVLWGESKESIAGKGDVIIGTVAYSSSNKIQYATSVAVDKITGAVTLVNPQELSIPSNSAEIAEDSCKKICALAPCYIMEMDNSAAEIYYIPSGATYEELGATSDTATLGWKSQSGATAKSIRLNGNAVTATPASKVTSAQKVVQPGEITYVMSTERNAYPDGGVVDGATYTYLGQPLSNAALAARVQVGDYAGTGLTGSSNPVELHFDDPAHVLFIFRQSANSFYPLGSEDGTAWAIAFPVIPGTTRAVFTTTGNGLAVTTSADGRTVSYYSNDADAQLNTANYSYHYLAI